MTLIKPSEPAFMTAEQAARRRGYAAESELALRNALEVFCRGRWPDARVVHEMVMGAGRVRADVVAMCPAHLAAFEVKGEFDDTTRLLHQVGMYQLCVPEVWMVVPAKHEADAKLIRHLLPSVGLLTGTGMERYGHDKTVTLTVEAAAVPRPVVPDMLLEMLWASELRTVCAATQVYAPTAKSTRPAMIKALLSLTVEELMPACCSALRGRDALWRADAPIKQEAEQSP